MSVLSPQSAKWLFRLAAWQNFIGGTVIVCLYSRIYTSAGMVVPNFHYAQWVALIFVFGVMSYMTSNDPFGSRDLILACILGKTGSVLPSIYALLFHRPDTPLVFLIPSVTDSLIALMFLYFYVQASRVGAWKGRAPCRV